MQGSRSCRQEKYRAGNADPFDRQRRCTKNLIPRYQERASFSERERDDLGLAPVYDCAARLDPVCLGFKRLTRQNSKFVQTWLYR